MAKIRYPAPKTLCLTQDIPTSLNYQIIPLHHPFLATSSITLTQA